MSKKKRWSDLSPNGKKAVIAALVSHVILVGLAHRDLSHRPESDIRGPKWVWRMATASNSSFVAAYFLWATKASD